MKKFAGNLCTRVLKGALLLVAIFCVAILSFTSLQKSKSEILFAEDVVEQTEVLTLEEALASTNGVWATYELSGVQNLADISNGNIDDEADFALFLQTCLAASATSPITDKFQLKTDLDLGGKFWTSIPNFNGTFNGNGHKITGIIFETSGENGLFTNTGTNAVIKDLVIGMTYNTTGSIIVSGKNDGKIVTCYSEEGKDLASDSNNLLNCTAGQTGVNCFNYDIIYYGVDADSNPEKLEYQSSNTVMAHTEAEAEAGVVIFNDNIRAEVAKEDAKYWLGAVVSYSVDQYDYNGEGMAWMEKSTGIVTETTEQQLANHGTPTSINVVDATKTFPEHGSKLISYPHQNAIRIRVYLDYGTITAGIESAMQSNATTFGSLESVYSTPPTSKPASGWRAVSDAIKLQCLRNGSYVDVAENEEYPVNTKFKLSLADGVTNINGMNVCDGQNGFSYSCGAGWNASNVIDISLPNSITAGNWSSLANGINPTVLLRNIYKIKANNSSLTSKSATIRDISCTLLSADGDADVYVKTGVGSTNRAAYCGFTNNGHSATLYFNNSDAYENSVNSDVESYKAIVTEESSSSVQKNSSSVSWATIDANTGYDGQVWCEWVLKISKIGIISSGNNLALNLHEFNPYTNTTGLATWVNGEYQIPATFVLIVFEGEEDTFESNEKILAVSGGARDDVHLFKDSCYKNGSTYESSNNTDNWKDGTNSSPRAVAIKALGNNLIRKTYTFSIKPKQIYYTLTYQTVEGARLTGDKITKSEFAGIEGATSITKGQGDSWNIVVVNDAPTILPISINGFDTIQWTFGTYNNGISYASRYAFKEATFGIYNADSGESDVVDNTIFSAEYSLAERKLTIKLNKPSAITDGDTVDITVVFDVGYNKYNVYGVYDDDTAVTNDFFPEKHNNVTIVGECGYSDGTNGDTISMSNAGVVTEKVKGDVVTITFELHHIELNSVKLYNNYQGLWTTIEIGSGMSVLNGEVSLNVVTDGEIQTVTLTLLGLDYTTSARGIKIGAVRKIYTGTFEYYSQDIDADGNDGDKHLVKDGVTYKYDSAEKKWCEYYINRWIDCPVNPSIIEFCYAYDSTVKLTRSHNRKYYLDVSNDKMVLDKKMTAESINHYFINETSTPATYTLNADNLKTGNELSVSIVFMPSGIAIRYISQYTYSEWDDKNGNGLVDYGEWIDKNGNGMIDAGEWTDRNKDSIFNEYTEAAELNENGEWDFDKCTKFSPNGTKIATYVSQWKKGKSFAATEATKIDHYTFTNFTTIDNTPISGSLTYYQLSQMAEYSQVKIYVNYTPIEYTIEVNDNELDLTQNPPAWGAVTPSGTTDKYLVSITTIYAEAVGVLVNKVNAKTGADIYKINFFDKQHYSHTYEFKNLRTGRWESCGATELYKILDNAEKYGTKIYIKVVYKQTDKQITLVLRDEAGIEGATVGTITLEFGTVKLTGKEEVTYNGQNELGDHLTTTVYGMGYWVHTLTFGGVTIAEATNINGSPSYGYVVDAITDTLISDNDKIYLEYHFVAITVIFEGTFIGGEQRAGVNYGTSVLKQLDADGKQTTTNFEIPNPVREGYVFEYWLAVDDNADPEVEFYIEKVGSGWIIYTNPATKESTTITSTTTPIVFYAYWAINNEYIENNAITTSPSEYADTYDGEWHEIVVGYGGADYIGTKAITKDGSPFNGGESFEVKYVDHSGTYLVNVTTAFKDSDPSDVYSKHYIVQAESLPATIQKSIVVEITPATLEMETISKTYDGEVSGDASGMVSGFKANDDDALTFTANYANPNVELDAENNPKKTKDVMVTANYKTGATDGELILGSYVWQGGGAISEENTLSCGEITPRTITLEVGGDVVQLSGDPVQLTANLRAGASVLTDVMAPNYSTLRLTDGEVCNHLAKNRMLSFTITTTSGNKGIYSANNNNLEVTFSISGTDYNDNEEKYNYTVVVDGEIELIWAEEDEVLIIFKANGYDEAKIWYNTGAIEHIEISDDLFIVIASMVPANKKISINFTSGDYWINQITTKLLNADGSDGEIVKDDVLEDVITSSPFNYAYSDLTEKNAYVVELNFTNESIIQFKRGQDDGNIFVETIILEYGNILTVPDLTAPERSRENLTPVGWYDKSENIILSGTWQNKGNYTFYAVWDAEVEFTTSGMTNATFTYCAKNLVTLSFTVDKNDRIACVGTFTGPAGTGTSLTLRDVAHSGTYTFTYSATNNDIYDDANINLIRNIHASCVGGQSCVVTINPYKFTLKNITKTFDGTKTHGVTIDASRINTSLGDPNAVGLTDEVKAEIFNKSFTIVFDSVKAETIKSATNDTSILTNYAISYSAVIAKRNITININGERQTKEYDGTIFEINHNQTTVQDTLGALTYNTFTFLIQTSSANVGEYPSAVTGGVLNLINLIIKMSGVDEDSDGVLDNLKDSFNISISDDSTLEITKRAYGISTTQNEFTYLAKAIVPKITVVTVGGQQEFEVYVGTQTESGVKVEISITCPTGVSLDNDKIKNAGEYTVTVKVVASGNYKETTETFIYTVNKYTVSIVQKGVFTKTYDGTTAASLAIDTHYELKHSGTVLTEGNDQDKLYRDEIKAELSFSFNGRGVVDSDNLNQSIGNLGKNYDVTMLQFTGRITPAPLTVVFEHEEEYNNKSEITINHTTANNILTATGLVNGENLSKTTLKITTGVFNVGTYTSATVTASDVTITKSSTYTDNSFNNYDVTYVFTITITKKPITVVICSENGSRPGVSEAGKYVYNKAKPTLRHKVYDLLGNEYTPINLTVSCTASNNVNVGLHEATIDATGTGAGNYNISYQKGYEIVKKVIDLIFDEQKQYDGTVFAYSLGMAYDSILCAGDTFNGSTITTAGAYVYNYFNNFLTKNIVIKDKTSGDDMTENYDVKTNSIVLRIVAIGALEADGFVIETYVYNGTAQEPSITINAGSNNGLFKRNIVTNISNGGNNVDGTMLDFTAELTDADINKDSGQTITIFVTPSGRNGGGILATSFKYAGTYSFVISSEITYADGPANGRPEALFAPTTIEIAIAKAIISDYTNSEFEGAEKILARQYNNTGNIFNVENSDPKVVSQADNELWNNSGNVSYDYNGGVRYNYFTGKIGANDIYDECVRLVGTRGDSSLIGERNVTFALCINTSVADASLINLIKGSYKLSPSISAKSVITKRYYVLGYKADAPTVYYDGADLNIELNNFNALSGYVVDTDNTIFVSGAMASGHSLGGYIVFNGVVNAGQKVNAGQFDATTINTERMTAPQDWRSYYEIIFDFNNEVTINKAQIKVQSIIGTEYTYDGTPKTVTTITAMAQNGQIANSDNPSELLTAKYSLSDDGANKLDGAINAGTYYIYPEVRSGITNYEYCGELYLNTRLIINKLEVAINLERQVTYISSEPSFVFYLEELGTQIVAGTPFPASHYDVGVLTIYNNTSVFATTPTAVTPITVTYTSNVSGQKVLTEFDITDGTNSQLSNYLVEYSIKLEFIADVSNGSAKIEVNETLTYSGTDLRNAFTIKLIYDTSEGEDFTKGEIANINEAGHSSVAEVIGFYSSSANAHNDTSVLASVINAGDYYVRVEVVASTVDLTTYKILIAKVVVNAKQIQNYFVDEDCITAYNNKKVFDNTNTITLYSSDIVNRDRGNITITGTYSSKNVGTGYTLTISLTGSNGSLTSNYSWSNLNGQEITPLAVVISAFNPSENYYYEGETTHTINAERFTVSGLLDASHELQGSVIAKVNTADDYYFGTTGVITENTLNVLANGVTNNYTLLFDSTLKVVVNKAQVTIYFNNTDAYTYGATNMFGDVVGRIVGTATYGAVVNDTFNTEKQEVTFSYDPNVGTDVLSTQEVINAGKYTINAFETINYVFTVGTPKAITINKKDAQINIGVQEKPYLDYINSGYNVEEGMLTNVLDSDKITLVNNTKYKLIDPNSKIADYTYYVQAGTNAGNNVYSAVEIVISSDHINNNYNFTSITGSIKILAEIINITTESLFTYDGNDHFGDILLGFDFNNDNVVDIQKTVSEIQRDGGIEFNFIPRSIGFVAIQLISVGEYTINFEVDTKPYDVNVEVSKRLLTLGNADQLIKDYDGNYNANGGNHLTITNAVTGDDVYVTGVYDDYIAGENIDIHLTIGGTKADNYTIEDVTGTINKKVINVEVDETFVYDFLNNYVVNYTITQAPTDTVANANLVVTLNNNIADLNPHPLSTQTVTNNIKITHGGDGEDVTDSCYTINISGGITVTKKAIVVYDINVTSADDFVFNNSNKTLTTTYNVKTNPDALGFKTGEKEIIISELKIEYSSDSIKNAGNYYVTISLSAAQQNCYSMTAETKAFTITPYELKLTSLNVGVFDGVDTYNPFTKEFATADPALTQEFIINFGFGNNYSVYVKYTRISGEAVNSYNLNGCEAYNSTEYDTKDQNINLTPQSGWGTDKFVITKNTTPIKITLTEWIDSAAGDGVEAGSGIFKTYYATNNIGQYKLNQFAFNAIANHGIDASNSKITYNVGDVGGTGYKVASCAITSSNYENIEVDADNSIMLQILKRTVQISSSKGYNKTYDGTTTFVNGYTLNYNHISSQGTWDDVTEASPITIVYGNANAGSTTLTVNNLNNFEFVFSGDTDNETTATINPLQVTALLTSVSSEYGSLNVSQTGGVVYGELSYSVAYSLSTEAQTAGISLSETDVKAGISFKVLKSSDGSNASLSTAGKLVVGSYHLQPVASNFTITNVTDGVVAVSAGGAKTTYEVTTRELTVEFTPDIPSKKEDGTPTIDVGAFTYVLQNIISGDDVNVLSAEFAQSAARANISINITSISGADSLNYTAICNQKGEIYVQKINITLNYGIGYVINQDGDPLLDISKLTLELVGLNYYSLLSNYSIPTGASAPKTNGEIGYEFVGWSVETQTEALASTKSGTIIDYDEIIKDIDGLDVETTGGSDDPFTATIYAVWKKKTYNIVVNEERQWATSNKLSAEYTKTEKFGDAVNVYKLDYLTTFNISASGTDYSFAGTPVSLSVPEYSDTHIYMGYMVDTFAAGEKIKTPYTVTESNTLFIVYNLQERTVTIDPNGGYFGDKTDDVAVKTYTVLYGQKVAAQSGTDNLNVLKTGYSLKWATTVGEKDGSTILKDEVIEQDITYTANWTANTYTLTIKSDNFVAGDDDFNDNYYGYGYFDNFAGWTKEQEYGGKTYIISLEVTYDQDISSFVLPTKNYYTFVNYTNEATSDEWTNADNTDWKDDVKTWTITGDVTLVANYDQNEYTLTVNVNKNGSFAEQATIKVEQLVPTYREIANPTAVAGSGIVSYVFTFKTEDEVKLSASIIKGYVFDTSNYFTCVGDIDGTEYDNTVTFKMFKDNLIVSVNTEPGTNIITLTTNGNEKGKLTAEHGGNIATSDSASNTIEVKTEQTLEITLEQFEGYTAVPVWSATPEAGYNTPILSGDDSTLIRELSGFNGNVIIYVELKAEALQIIIVNESEKGDLFYSNKQVLGNEITIETNAGQNVTLQVSPKYGYDLTVSNLTDVSAIGTNATISVSAPEYGVYTIELQNVTKAGTFTITYSINKYTITFVYAEYDEEVDGYALNIHDSLNLATYDAGANTFVNNVSVEFEYLTEIDAQSAYFKAGYKFKEFKGAVFDETTGEIITNAVDSLRGVITSGSQIQLSVTKNLTVVVVYERETYIVSFTVDPDSETHGKLTTDGGATYSNHMEFNVRFGRDITAVTAVAVDSYRTFNYWKVDGAIVGGLSSEISGLTATQNITYVAVFEAQDCDLTVIINAENSIEICEDINNVFNGLSGAVVKTGGISIDADKNITAELTYKAGSTINFALNNEEYYLLNFGGELRPVSTFEMIDSTPNKFTDNKWIINLGLKSYEVEVTSNKADQINIAQPPISGDVSADTNKDGDIIAIFTVKHGTTFSINYYIQSGYMFSELTTDPENIISSDDITNSSVTVNNLEQAIKLNFVLIPTVYQITFNTNKPTKDFLRENISGVVNSTVIAYVDLGGCIIKNADGDQDNGLFDSIINLQQFEYNSARWEFIGWSLGPDGGTTYYLDQESYKIYTLDGDGNKIYSFDTVFTELSDDGRTRAGMLYAQWTIPIYKVKIMLNPDFKDSSIIYDFVTSKYGCMLSGIDEDGFIDLSQGEEYPWIEVVPGVKIVDNYKYPNITDYNYSGWSVLSADGTEVLKDFDNNNIDYLATSDCILVLHYSFTINVKVNEPLGANNIAYIGESGITELECLNDDSTYTLRAVANPGYEFVCWKVDGVEISKNATLEIIPTQKTEYVAVFRGKKVNVYYDASNLVTFSIDDSDEIRVGDIITIVISEVAYGYNIIGISIEGNTSIPSVEENGKIVAYEYKLTPEDGERGSIIIKSLTNAKQVGVTFTTKLDKNEVPELASGEPINVSIGSIYVNDKNLTNKFYGEFSFGQTLTIEVKPSVGMQLIGIKINGVAQANMSEALSYIISESAGFGDNADNKIEFVFKKVYWISLKKELMGAGTKESPYLINSAETLAYLAYLINDGVIDQYTRKIYYKVTSNINLSNYFWISIGTEQNPFNGVFDIGKFQIVGAKFGEKYEKCRWEEYCPGVFAYLTDDAQIVFESAATKGIIIIIAAISALALFIAVSVIIFIKNKKNKMKKLSDNLSMSTVQKIEEIEDQTDESSGDLLDDKDKEFNEIIKKAQETLGDVEEIQEPISNKKKPPKKPEKKMVKPKKPITNKPKAKPKRPNVKTKTAAKRKPKINK